MRAGPATVQTVSGPRTLNLTSDNLGVLSREVKPDVSTILGRPNRGDVVAPYALMAAEVFPELRENLKRSNPRTTINSIGELTLTFTRGMKHAVLTADADGELTLLLTDRGSEDEPEAEVIGHEGLSILQKIQAFLER